MPIAFFYYYYCLTDSCGLAQLSKREPCEESFRIRITTFFDRLREGIDQQNGGVDIEQLLGSCALLGRLLMRCLQRLLMREDTP